MKRLVEKNQRWTRRKRRIRGRVRGSSDRPRLTVFRSNKNVYAQAIDDSTGKTIAAASTVSGDFKSLGSTAEDAAKIGEAIGAALKKKKIKEVVFDRNGYLYHGVVKAVADGARKSGLTF